MRPEKDSPMAKIPIRVKRPKQKSRPTPHPSDTEGKSRSAIRSIRQCYAFSMGCTRPPHTLPTTRPTRSPRKSKNTEIPNGQAGYWKIETSRHQNSKFNILMFRIFAFWILYFPMEHWVYEYVFRPSTWFALTPPKKRAAQSLQPRAKYRIAPPQ